VTSVVRKGGRFSLILCALCTTILQHLAFLTKFSPRCLRKLYEVNELSLYKIPLPPQNSSLSLRGAERRSNLIIYEKKIRLPRRLASARNDGVKSRGEGGIFIAALPRCALCGQNERGGGFFNSLRPLCPLWLKKRGGEGREWLPGLGSNLRFGIEGEDGAHRDGGRR
jgi:hypothetical protein